MDFATHCSIAVLKNDKSTSTKRISREWLSFAEKEVDVVNGKDKKNGLDDGSRIVTNVDIGLILLCIVIIIVYNNDDLICSISLQMKSMLLYDSFGQDLI